MGSFIRAVALPQPTSSSLVNFGIDHRGDLSVINLRIHLCSNKLLWPGTTRRWFNFRCSVHVGEQLNASSDLKLHRHSLQSISLYPPIDSSKVAAGAEDETRLLTCNEIHQPLLKAKSSPNSTILTLIDTELGSADTDLESTLSQQLWVMFGCSVLGTMAIKSFREVDSVETFVAACVSIVLAYWLADLGTGIYHWAMDNYGDASSVMFGSQIDAFQGHHKRPWTITKRQFANNLYSLARPVGFVLLPAIFVPGNVSFDAFAAVFMACIVFSQQFHAWSHMKKSQLPALVRLLQDHGLLISPKMHGQHHHHPYNCNYCIVSGFWNPVLDSSNFFKNLEWMIYALWKVVPRSWDATMPQQHQTSHFEEEDAAAAAAAD
ncbi:hypothetical protein O6H91_22G022200 [Diphasiastrum complanatum]|uniref:Uncharacterized protein n=1 Tax=Diphasiastrum complanatum TaxID=34168 RepID=A0ACC2ADQ5_DIPCM|nr:hypothetical protein O6H91_22G022200 [Diphasiastrum complanatum]